MKRFVFWVVGLLILLAVSSVANAETNDSTSTAKFIGTPIASASSDEGVVIGAVAGFARDSGGVFYLSAYQSTKRYTGLGLRGEFNAGDWRVVTKNHITRILRKVYPATGDVVEEYAHATVNRLQIDVAALKAFDGDFLSGNKSALHELGPSFVMDVSQAENPEDINGESLNLERLYAFQRASTAQLGVRLRIRTTSASRPVDGFVFDSKLLAGRTSGESLSKPKFKFDASFSAWLAVAQPLSQSTRLYLRGSWQLQGLAPPPIRNWLGGDNTLRGQPDHRDLGREIVMGRVQLHQMLISEWLFPMKTVNRVLSFFPVWAVDVEAVGFYDIGRCGDADFGWNPMRQGYGGGFRVVVPPELTLAFDFAITPHGGKMFYFGMGETL